MLDPVWTAAKVQQEDPSTVWIPRDQLRRNCPHYATHLHPVCIYERVGRRWWERYESVLLFLGIVVSRESYHPRQCVGHRRDPCLVESLGYCICNCRFPRSGLASQPEYTRAL